MDIENLRLALSYMLISKLGDMGKVQLQKYVYFLQAAYNVPVEYSFKMYHYGPYSEDLDRDMTILKLLGYINIDRDADGYGYHLTALDEPDDDWNTIMSPYSESLENATQVFGKLSASDLELYATIHFVNDLNGEPPQQEVVNTVHSLKPKFNESTINTYYALLQHAGLLQ